MRSLENRTFNTPSIQSHENLKSLSWENPLHIQGSEGSDSVRPQNQNMGRCGATSRYLSRLYLDQVRVWTRAHSIPKDGTVRSGPPAPCAAGSNLPSFPETCLKTEKYIRIGIKPVLSSSADFAAFIFGTTRTDPRRPLKPPVPRGLT